MLIQDHPNRDLLIAYVDGRLESDQVEEAIRIIERDPLAGAFVDQLRYSALPYADAFECFLQVPVPEKIRNVAEAYGENIESKSGVTAHAAQKKDRIKIQSQAVAGAPRHVGRRFWSGIAAGFIAGVISTGFVANWSPAPEDAATAFIENVSQYQSLYQRDTVIGAKADLPLLEQIMTRELGRNINIPDFSKEGLEC